MEEEGVGNDEGRNEGRDWVLPPMQWLERRVTDEFLMILVAIRSFYSNFLSFQKPSRSDKRNTNSERMDVLTFVECVRQYGTVCRDVSNLKQCDNTCNDTAKCISKELVKY